MDEPVLCDNLAKSIAGSIVISEFPGAEINKWRNIFKIPQYTLAKEMKVQSSVVSDYESGRRKSPGVGMIKKVVNALLAIDEGCGSFVANDFNERYSSQRLSDAIIDTRDLKDPKTINCLAVSLNGKLIAEKEYEEKNIHGYTIIDSMKAIVGLPPKEFVKLSGLAKNRAMVFTGIQSGKSPLVALKVANVKPGVVVFHGRKELDPLAERIARIEKIPVIVSSVSNVDELIATFNRF